MFGLCGRQRAQIISSLLKLLFDQNISPKITRLVEGITETAHQVRDLGLENASDTAIFDFAKANGYTIVTFDADFVDLSLVRGVPPKVIWLRTGNLTTKFIAELLRKKSIAVQDFVLSADKEILELLFE